MVYIGLFLRVKYIKTRPGAAELACKGSSPTHWNVLENVKEDIDVFLTVLLKVLQLLLLIKTSPVVIHTMLK